MACTLIRFDFVYADLIRWLADEYTNAYRDWESTIQFAEHIKATPRDSGDPHVDFDRAVHIAVSGAPIQGTFSGTFETTQARERYDNHSSLLHVQDEVREKFAKEERLSYQIAFPRFLWAFIDGLFIAPITFVQKNPETEGRICPDPSNTISLNDTG